MSCVPSTLELRVAGGSQHKGPTQRYDVVPYQDGCLDGPVMPQHLGCSYSSWWCVCAWLWHTLASLKASVASLCCREDIGAWHRLIALYLGALAGHG